MPCIKWLYDWLAHHCCQSNKLPLILQISWSWLLGPRHLYHCDIILASLVKRCELLKAHKHPVSGGECRLTNCWVSFSAFNVSSPGRWHRLKRYSEKCQISNQIQWDHIPVIDYWLRVSDRRTDRRTNGRNETNNPTTLHPTPSHPTPTPPPTPHPTTSSCGG